MGVMKVKKGGKTDRDKVKGEREKRKKKAKPGREKERDIFFREHQLPFDGLRSRD